MAAMDAIEISDGHQVIFGLGSSHDARIVTMAMALHGPAP